MDHAIRELYKTVGGWGAITVVCVYLGYVGGIAKHNKRSVQPNLVLIEKSNDREYDFLGRCQWAGDDELGSDYLDEKCTCIEQSIQDSGYRSKKEIGMYISILIMSYNNKLWTDAIYLNKAKEILDDYQKGNKEERYKKRLGYMDTLIRHADKNCPNLLNEKLKEISLYVK